VYFISSLAISSYLFMYFGMVQFQEDSRTALSWQNVCFLGANFISPAMIGLLGNICGKKTALMKIILFFSTVIALSSFYFIKAIPLVRVYRFNWGSVFSINNFTYFLFFLNVILFLPLAVIIFLIEKSSQEKSSSSKKRMNLIAFGILGIAFCLGVNFIASFGLDVYPVGSVFAAFVFITLAYPVLRCRPLELDLIVNKTLLYLLFIGPLLISHILISALFLDILGFLFATTFSLLVVIALVIFTPYKKIVEKLADKLIYSGKYDYQKVLYELCQSLNAIVDFDQLFERIVHIIAQTTDVEKIVVFSVDATTESLFLRASYGVESSLAEEFNLSSDEAIVVRAKKEGKMLIKEQLRQLEDTQKVEEEFKKIAVLDAELVAPLFYKENLLGLIVLSRKKSGDIYNQGDINVLNTFVAEAAKAIEHVRLYSQAIVDESTTVFNQNYFLMRLRDEIARSKRYGHSISLMFLKINISGGLNNTAEPEMRDLLLKGVGLLLKTKVRTIDIVARYSDLVFAVLLPETAQAAAVNSEEKAVKHRSDTMIVAERLSGGIENFKNKYKGKIINMDVAIGITCFSGLDKKFTEENFINSAERALEKANQGKRNIVWFEDNR